MSTRANFLVLSNDPSIVSQYYNHWDGYPEGLGRKLKRYINEALSIRSKWNSSLGCAFLKAIQDDLRSPGSLEGSFEAEGSYPIDSVNQLHGDIEYLYLVDLSGDKPSLWYLPCYNILEGKEYKDIIDYHNNFSWKEIGLDRID